MGGGTGSKLNKLHDIVTVDSYAGAMAFGSDSGRVEVYDSDFYGGHNMANKDCPNGNKCQHCIVKRGLWIPTFGGHSTSMEFAPKHLKFMIMGGGSWGGESLFNNLRFIGWDKAENECGASQAAIGTNYKHSDYHPLANFRNI